MARRLVLKMSMSLDGFVAGLNGEVEWLFRHRDAGATAWIAETLWQAGVHVMGSRTYADMAAYWPTSNDTLAAPMNDIPKVVFTRKPSLDVAAAGWAETRIANGDLAAEIGRLKGQQGKDIVAHGGAGFAQSLARSGVIDEYRLLVHPVALGAGLPLFANLPCPAYLKLLNTSTFASGVTAQIYRPA